MNKQKTGRSYVGDRCHDQTEDVMASPNDFLLQTVTGTETSPETHTGKQVFNMCTHFKPWDVVHMQKADDRFIILLMFTFTGHEDSNGGKSCHCQVLQNAYMEEEDAYNFICHVNNSFNKSGKLTLGQGQTFHELLKLSSNAF